MIDKDFINFLNNPDSLFEYTYIPVFNAFIGEIDGKKRIEQSIIEADYGIAETGTAVISAKKDSCRKAMCISRKLSIVVLSSRLVEYLEDISSFLEEETSLENSYISFITGASRTADIENELIIGVHGPEIVQVYLIENR